MVVRWCGGSFLGTNWIPFGYQTRIVFKPIAPHFTNLLMADYIIPTEHLRDVVEQDILIMNVQLTNLQQLCDGIILIWAKVSKGMLPVESMLSLIKAVLSFLLFSLLKGF